MTLLKFFIMVGCIFSNNLCSHLNEYSRFIETYNKTYSSTTEYIQKYFVFSDNADKINAFNTINTDVQLAMNQYGDLTWYEFSEPRLTTFPQRKRYLDMYLREIPDTTNLISSIDWRQKGVVNKVRNQGQCGSCYSFSAISSLESAVALKHHYLPEFSEQQIVDCATDYGNFGCEGGLPDSVFKYVKVNKLCNRSQYEYTASEGECLVSGLHCKNDWSLTKIVDIPSNETYMQYWVSRQPISIGIEADKTIFQFYSKGIIRGNCGTSIDHAVVIVGFGQENGVPYWIVRNSWGEGWGEGGYVRIERNKNVCGISAIPSFPLVV